jgi:hypothetical protein
MTIRHTSRLARLRFLGERWRWAVRGGSWPKPGDPNPRKRARKNPAPYTGRSRYGARGEGLLVGHGDLEPVLGLDEMVVAVAADIDLHPVDLAGEFVAGGPVVG